MHMRGVLFVAFLIALTVSPVFSSDARVVVAGVRDYRSTNQSGSNLKIKLKLIDYNSSALRGIRVVVNSAHDNTGRNLLLPKDRKDHFKTVNSSTKRAEISVKLKNPVRKAVTIREITGKLQLFMPDRDPSASVLIRKFMKSPGRPITNAVLTGAGIVFTVLTKREYESLEKEEEKKIEEAARKQGLTQEAIPVFRGFLEGFFQSGDNALFFRISDPSSNLIDMDVLDAEGRIIHNCGYSKSDELMALNYCKAIPEDASLRLYLKTEKSVVSIPLRLSDIALP